MTQTGIACKVVLAKRKESSQVKRKENPVERNKLASLEATCIRKFATG